MKEFESRGHLCPLCSTHVLDHSDTWRIDEGSARLSVYHRCPYCDLIFLDPASRPRLEEERARYLEHNNSADDAGYVAYLEGFADEALAPHVPPPARLLDFGSGPVPVFADLMRARGYSVEIYDPIFAPGFPEPQNTGDAGGETGGVAGAYGRFDAVTAVEVAEHLFEPGREFARLRDALRPGGHLVLRTLLHYGDRSRFASWWYRQDPTHVCFYSAATFETLAQLLDMELIEIVEGRSVILRLSS